MDCIGLAGFDWLACIDRAGLAALAGLHWSGWIGRAGFIPVTEDLAKRALYAKIVKFPDARMDGWVELAGMDCIGFAGPD